MWRRKPRPEGWIGRACNHVHTGTLRSGWNDEEDDSLDACADGKGCVTMGVVFHVHREAGDLAAPPLPPQQQGPACDPFVWSLRT
jgi:hypothetical protein